MFGAGDLYCFVLREGLSDRREDESGEKDGDFTDHEEDWWQGSTGALRRC